MVRGGPRAGVTPQTVGSWITAFMQFAVVKNASGGRANSAAEAAETPSKKP